MEDKNKVKDVFKPLRSDGPYRHNPNRAIAPRVLATPRFHAMLSGKAAVPEASKAGFQICLDKLGKLHPIVDSGFMEGGHIIPGGFWIRTIWSHNPSIADIILITAPGDTGLLGIPLFYEQTLDETLLDPFVPIVLPYLN